MTQDFMEDAIEACNRERVPFVFAMRTGDEGEWVVNYNLVHHSSSTSNSAKEVCNLIQLSLAHEIDP
jgi:hypothetical protein